MKRYLTTANLPWFALGSSAIGLLLRIWLLTAGFDEGGLMYPWHAAAILLWVLTAVVAAVVIWGCRNIVEASKYGFNFPASQIGAAGTAAAALGILVSCILQLVDGADSFSTVAVILGFLAVGCLLFTANCRLKGQHPQIYFHGLVSVYLIFRLVSQYRVWSPDPQLQDYCFQLLATICLMLACYHRTMFDANMGKRRLYAIFSLLAVFFCLVSVPGCHDWLFYLTCGAWMVTNLCSLIALQSNDEPQGGSQS